jgi:hypothetical protein
LIPFIEFNIHYVQLILKGYGLAVHNSQAEEMSFTVARRLALAGVPETKLADTIKAASGTIKNREGNRLPEQQDRQRRTQRRRQRGGMDGQDR